MAKNESNFKGRSAPPDGWRLVAREMIYWAAPAWGDKTQEINPLMMPEDGRVDFSTGTKLSKRAIGSSAFTYRPCLTTSPSSDIPQKMLSVFDLRVLSELYSLMGNKNKAPDDMLLFTPSELINGLGLALAGSSYDRVEQSLTDLASFRVESTPENILNTDYLFSFMETGRVRVSSGVKSHNEKRYQFWRVQFGELLRKLLRYPSLFTSYPLTVYKEAGRSPNAQWATMFYFSHGHNSELIYDYKLTTLAKRSNLSAQLTKKMVEAVHKEAKSKGLDPLDEQGRINRAENNGLRKSAERMRKSIKKLVSTGIFKVMNIEGSDLNSPSKGRVQARRHSTAVEIFLSSFNGKLRKLIITGRSYLNYKLNNLLFSDLKLDKAGFNPASPPNPGWALTG